MVFNQFKQLFSADVALAKSIEQTGNRSLSLNFSDKQYTYKFLSNAVIRTRENKLKDTLTLAIIDFDFNTESSTSQKIVLNTKLMNETVQLFEAKEIELATQINDRYK